MSPAVLRGLQAWTIPVIVIVLWEITTGHSRSS